MSLNGSLIVRLKGSWGNTAWEAFVTWSTSNLFDWVRLIQGSMLCHGSLNVVICYK